MLNKRVQSNKLTDPNTQGRCVLYWMQHTQRIDQNYALYHAIKKANTLALPLKVLFVIVPDYKDATTRHYQFMLEGLKELQATFKHMGADFCVETGSFDEVLASYLKAASVFYLDDAYMPFMRQTKKHWIHEATSLKIPAHQFFSDTVVPVFQVSQKTEYSARTIRPKLLKQVDDYLDEVEMPKLKKRVNSSNAFSLEEVMNTLDVKVLSPVTEYFKGGETAAFDALNQFFDTRLKHYPKGNDPSTAYTSQLSPYLHFGMLSPVRVYLEAQHYLDQYPEATEGFLEQLLVRRELAFNFVWYHDGFDQFNQMTYGWAYDTMDAHREDARATIYTLDDYLKASTHDAYFNAAMKEMMFTGYMHNTMRMYWGKKIIEWSKNYESAYETILYLNNHFFLDGRDPVSYASVAWLFGQHDRAWASREIFGKMRYMNANGLKRKYAIEDYVKQMNALKKPLK